MSGENFGYTPPPAGPYGQYDDYIKPGALDGAIDTFGDSQHDIVVDGESKPNEADVDNAMMDKLWLIVARESDELTATTARLWRDISALLEHTRANVQSHAEALALVWKSPAATSFLTHVGAGLYSLDEWKKSADENASALGAISVQVSQTQTEVKKIWDDYKAREAVEMADRKDKGLGDIVDGNWADDYDEVSREYANKARPHVQTLATAYTEAIYYKLGRGTQYKGPIDAKVQLPSAVPPSTPGAPPRPARPGRPPNRPNGDRPARPDRPELQGQPDRPDRPEVPDRPELPNRPELPDRPDGPELAGGVVQPPPAPPQVSVPTTGPGGGGHVGPPPTAPVVPPTGPGGRAGGGPNLRGNAPPRPGTPQLPGTGRGGPGGAPGGQRPGAPQLPGRGGQGARPGAPGRGGAPAAPNLPGRNGQGGRPGAPGRGGRPGAPGVAGEGRAGQPSLPGRGGQGRPGAPRVPGGVHGPETPSNLSGRGGSAPSKPNPAPKPALDGTRGARPGGAGHVPDPHATTGPAGTKGAPGLGGRRQPTAPGQGVEPPGTRPGVNPSLGGRSGTGPSERDLRGGGYPSTQRRQPHQADDEELWAVEEAAPAVIDKPAEERADRPEPGPTLGAGR